MTLFHDYFILRNFKAFQRLLDAVSERGQSNAALSTSASKSWTKAPAFKLAPDINARDWLGRTVLHLACADLDSLEYVRLILRQSAINVNIADTESHWTPLHRALYNGNIPAALLLLQRADIDSSIQDHEGYTAFDVYNSTLEGTKPARNKLYSELYVWGTNRNAALGVGDSSDRTFPDPVAIGRKDDLLGTEDGRIARFEPVRVRQIDMSKLHTAVVTNEGKGNLRLCGFGSGGRLGPGQHTQYHFTPLHQLAYTIVSVALGQDHTLALTSSGEILSWGLNRFAQLGYVIDGPAPGEGFGRGEEPIQPTPRKIQGPLRKEIIRGVAASKSASACWTDTDVFTWGTNNGQLGYDRTGHPQILPRKATKVTSPVIAIAMTDVAMSCLLLSYDVICIWNDRHVKIQFPIHAFPSEIQPYRPPQSIKSTKIAKVVGHDEIFAALSFNGELFTFSPPVTSDTTAAAVTPKEKLGFKPQRVWALRKKFSSVKDVALGSDGSIIICTVSGHVFTRSRMPTKTGQQSSTKPFKFQRIPYLQRIVQVCANSTGAFAALKEEHSPAPIIASGNILSQDLADVLPFIRWSRRQGASSITARSEPAGQQEEELDTHLANDVARLSSLLDILERQNVSETGGSPPGSPPTLGADVIVHLPNGYQIPTHGVILGARSRVLGEVLNGATTLEGGQWKITMKRSRVESSHPRPIVHLSITGCHPLSIFILLGFLYSDEVLVIWDRRLSLGFDQRLKALKIDSSRIKTDLRALAEVLNLPTLFPVLEKPVKHNPSASILNDMCKLFESVQESALSPATSVIAPDVILQLADREIRTHSIVLRARSPFFADFFGEEDWTKKRWSPDGIITINMKHLKWRVMDFVLRHLCRGEDTGILDILTGIRNMDELLDFVFDIMKAANELLLSRLVLLCSVTIIHHISLYNACYMLVEASSLDADDLTSRIQRYIAVNLESFLESGMLDDVPLHLTKRLSQFIKIAQADKYPVSRSGTLTEKALVLHADWLALQDIPQPIDERDIDPSVFQRQDCTRSSPKKKKVWQEATSPMASPIIQPMQNLHHRASVDDIFQMDDGDSYLTNTDAAASQAPPLIAGKPVTSGGAPVWKATSVPKVDMRTLMAEAASASRNSIPNTTMASRRSQQELRRASEDVSGLVGNPVPPTGSPLRLSAQAHPRIPSGPGGATALLSTPTHRGPASVTAQAQFLPPPPKKPSTPKTPQRPTSPPSGPGLGPVITPTRQPLPSSSSSPSIRRVSGKIWNQASSAGPPVVTAGMSFAAIQQLEQDLEAGGLKQEKRSLVDIQQEEKDRRQETDFLAWWAAEEERVKMEAEAAMIASQQETSRPRGGPKRNGQQRRGAKRDNPQTGQGGPSPANASSNTPRRPTPRKPKKTEL